MAIVMTVEAILARHVPAASYGSEPPICTWCEQDWPCEVAVVAQHGAAERARLDAVVDAVRAWATDPVVPGEPEEAYAYRELQFEDRMIDALTAYDARRQATPQPTAAREG